MASARRGAALALAALLAAPAGVAAASTSYFDCRVTSVAQLDHLGRAGQPAELSQFTCRVRGGLLDGFVATGTNIWEPSTDGDVLVGSIVVARRGDSTVVYEVEQASRRPAAGEHRGGVRQGTGRGTYKLATGAAAPLAGKSFHSIARSDGPGAFTIEAVIND